MAANDQLVSQGYCVVWVATRQGGAELNQLDNNLLAQDLTLLGLVAIIDPPRPEVADVIAPCDRAGIQVTMIISNYRLTATAITQGIGLGNGNPKIITGEQLGHLSDTQLRQILHKQKTGLVFARVMPEQKLTLVAPYKTLGHVVTVSGDGVNHSRNLDRNCCGMVTNSLNY